MSAPVNNSSMRRINRGLVFKALVLSPGISRADLSRQLHLSKMSITNIVSGLLESGLIQETDKIILNAPHKNPTGLDLSPDCPKMLGIQIQRDYCRGVVCDFRLQVYESAEVPLLEPSQKNLEQALLELLSRLSRTGILGIGVGSIGPVDQKAGRICNPPNFGDIRNFDVVSFLQKHVSVPVVLNHHYDCAALAESMFGIGRQFQNFLYLGLSRGIGASGIADGQLYSSFFHTIPEIGHISVDWHGQRCRCGNRGCLEQYVSTHILQKKLRAQTGLDKSFADFCQLYPQKEVADCLTRAMDCLSVALTGCANLFLPEAILIGDRGRFLPEECLTYLEEQLNASCLSRKSRPVCVTKSSISDEMLTASAALGIAVSVFSGELLL